MAAALGMFNRLRKPKPAREASIPAQDNAPRSPEEMIAGCEYELRQVRRDVQRTRERPRPSLTQLMAQKKPEPFLPGARQRSAAVPAASSEAAINALKSA